MRSRSAAVTIATVMLIAPFTAACKKSGLYVNDTNHVEAWITQCRQVGIDVQAQVVVKNTDVTGTNGEHRYVVTLEVYDDKTPDKFLTMVEQTSSKIPNGEYGIVDLRDSGILERRTAPINCVISEVGIVG